MRLVSFLGILTLLAGCPIEITDPDASMKDVDHDDGTSDPKDGRPMAGTNGAVGGSGGWTAPREGSYDGGVPSGYDAGAPLYPEQRDPYQQPSSPAHVALILTGSPSELDALSVMFEAVEARVFIDGQERWFPLSVQPQWLDVAALVDGNAVLLGGGPVPPALFRQLGLRIGHDAAVVVGGEEHPLPLAPELAHQGVLVDLGIDAQSGMLYTVMLGFDVRHSLQLREGSSVLAPSVHVLDVQVQKVDDPQSQPAPGDEYEPAPGDEYEPTPGDEYEPTPGDGGVGEPPPPGPDGGVEPPTDDLPAN